MAQKVCSLLISPEKFQQQLSSGSLVLDSRGPTGKKPLATLLQKLVSTLPSALPWQGRSAGTLDRSSGPVNSNLSELMKNPSGKPVETSTSTAKLSLPPWDQSWCSSKTWYQRIKLHR